MAVNIDMSARGVNEYMANVEAEEKRRQRDIEWFLNRPSLRMARVK